MDNPSFKGDTDHVAATTEVELGNRNFAPHDTQPPPYNVEPPAYYNAPPYPPPHPIVSSMYGSSGRMVVTSPNQTVVVQPSTSSAVIVTGAITTLGSDPVTIICPHCRHTVTTRVTYHTGTTTHLCAVLSFCFFCWCCICVPYLTDCTKDAAHYCPACQNQIGFFHR